MSMQEVWRVRTTARWLKMLEEQRPRTRASSAPGKAQCATAVLQAMALSLKRPQDSMIWGKVSGKDSYGPGGSHEAFPGNCCMLTRG
jgi:hypothetical protein